MGILNDISNFLHGGVSNNYHTSSYGAAPAGSTQAIQNFVAGTPAPAPAPAPAPTGPSGGGSGGSVAPVINPATTNFMKSLPGQLSTIRSGELDPGSSAHTGLVGGINDLVAQLRIGQNNIDQQGVQNEESRQQGTQGVLSMIQHGLQSGGITLANKGASTSSAAEALARAYSDIGRRAQTQVGQQYAQGQHAVDVSQNNFNIDKGAKVGDIQTQKAQAINSIVSDAQNKLAYLNSLGAGAGAPNSVNVDAEKEAVRQQATSQLADIDQILSSGVGGINPLAQSERQGQAASLLQQGTAPTSQFSYTTAGPLQVQNSGPVAAQLPIFTNPAKKTT